MRDRFGDAPVAVGSSVPKTMKTSNGVSVDDNSPMDVVGSMIPASRMGVLYAPRDAGTTTEATCMVRRILPRRSAPHQRTFVPSDSLIQTEELRNGPRRAAKSAKGRNGKEERGDEREDLRLIASADRTEGLFSLFLFSPFALFAALRP